MLNTIKIVAYIQANGHYMNSIVKIAKTKREEKYITPEDVVDALNKGRVTIELIRRDVLEILGKQTEYGTEDAKLCAFIAWNGKIS